MSEIENGIHLILGDITKQQADAIVTAANEGLRGGGGVDEAVHRAAGPQLLAVCREIGGCPTGSAAITPAFDLEKSRVRHVIHAVGPVWRGGRNKEPDLLESAYRKALSLAEEARLTSIAFPSISTGVYGFPPAPAASIALRVAHEFLSGPPRHLKRILFVLFNSKTHDVFLEALKHFPKETSVASRPNSRQDEK